VLKVFLVSVTLLLAIKPVPAAPLPPVTVWLDKTGREVVVAYGVTQVTKMAELDRDEATLIARGNLASFLNCSVVPGSVVIMEWRHVGGDRNGGLEIVAVKWSAASARSAAALLR